MTFPNDPNVTKSPNEVREYKPYHPVKNPVKLYKMPVRTSPERMKYLQGMCRDGFAVYFRYPLWDRWIHVSKPQWIPEVLYTIRNRPPETPAEWEIPVGEFNRRAN